MIQLSDMQLAREVERQRSELHILCGMPEEIEVPRGLRYLDAGGPDDLNEIVGVMRDCRDRLDVEGWRDAVAALFCVASDHQVAEWKILESVLSRLFDRLADRVVGGRGWESIAKHAATIVEMTGAAICNFSRVVGYKPVADRKDFAWSTDHVERLGPDDGPEEERAAYDRAVLSAGERDAFDFYFSEHLPPLGMCFTAACIASDLARRYEPLDDLARLKTIECASDIIEHAADVIC